MKLNDAFTILQVMALTLIIGFQLGIFTVLYISKITRDLNFRWILLFNKAKELTFKLWATKLYYI